MARTVGIGNQAFVLSHLNSIGELLYHLRVGFQVAFLRTVGGVGNVARLFTQRRHHIAGAFPLQGSGKGLKLYCIVCIAGGEGSGS